MGFLDFIFGNNKNKDINTKKNIEKVKQIGKYAVLNNEREESIEYDIPCKIKNVLISKNGKYIASSAQGEFPSFDEEWEMEDYYSDGPHKFAALRIWEYDTFKILKEFVNINVKAMNFSNDSEIFAIAYEDDNGYDGYSCSKKNYIEIIDTNNFKTIKTIILDKSEQCMGIALSNDLKYIATTIWYKKEYYIKTFDISSYQEVSKINLEYDKFYYKSSIMEFSYDDKFLIFTLDEDPSSISSPLSIINMAKCKEQYRINSVSHESIDIGNISNKIIYHSYENNHDSYYILQMDSNTLSEIPNYQSSYRTIAKFNLDDSKCFITGYTGDNSLNESLIDKPIRDAISVFDSNSLKNIKTISVSKIIGSKIDEIRYVDITRYNEWLVFCEKYNGYYYLACVDCDDFSTIYVKNIPSSIKQVGSTSTSYCRDKEVMVLNRYYCGSHDHTFVFSTYEEALNNLPDIDRMYFDNGKYEHLDVWVRNL